MIKLLKDTSKSITDANYNEFSCVLTILSVVSIFVFSIFTGIGYFATTPEEMGNLSHIAPPGAKVWLNRSYLCNNFYCFRHFYIKANRKMPRLQAGL